MYKLVVLAVCVAFIASANAQLLGGGGMMEAMLLSQMLQNNNQNTGSSSASSTSASRPGVLGVLGGSGSSSTSSSNPFASMFGSGGNPQLFGNMGRLMMLQGKLYLFLFVCFTLVSN